MNTGFITIWVNVREWIKSSFTKLQPVIMYNGNKLFLEITECKWGKLYKKCRHKKLRFKNYYSEFI